MDLTYYELKQYEKAIEDYNKAIELNPNDAEVYTNRGNPYYKLKRYEKAIEDYSKAIKLNPNDAVAYYNRGNAYDELKRYEKAIEDYSKAIELNPNYVDAYNNRGNAYRELNQHEEAIEDYNKSIELNPKYAEAYSNRGIAYLLTNKDSDKAITDFKCARDLSEENDKERMLGFIAWAKARREMDKKNWDGFRERMEEAREIFEKINDPLSHSFAASIKFSFVDEELDNAFYIPDPTEALKKIENALKTPLVVEGLIEPDRTIFNARIWSFDILYWFISSMRSIDGSTDMSEMKEKLAELRKRSKEVEEAFESVNFDTGKTTIVNLQRIIGSVKEEIEEIKWAANKKQKAFKILEKYWSRLSSVIIMINGRSTRETENRALEREIREMKGKMEVGFAETEERISGGVEKISKEIHKAKEEIFQEICKTENISIKELVNVRYRIEFPPSPSPAKIIIDIPMGKLTEEQVKKIADQFNFLPDKVKEEFLKACAYMKLAIYEKLLNRLKKTKG